MTNRIYALVASLLVVFTVQTVATATATDTLVPPTDNPAPHTAGGGSSR